VLGRCDWKPFKPLQEFKRKSLQASIARETFSAPFAEHSMGDHGISVAARAAG